MLRPVALATRPSSLQYAHAALSELNPPDDGKFSLETLDAALNSVFPKSEPMSFVRRVELKNAIMAAGMLAEELPIANVKIVEKALAMLKKCGIPVPKTYAYSLSEINAALDKTTLSPSERIELKTTLMSAQLMERQGIVTPLQKPGVNVARSIFAQLDLDAPAPGQKVGLGTLNKAMVDKGLSVERKIYIKTTLHAAGMLAA
jgi:hypothetical protein